MRECQYPSDPVADLHREMNAICGLLQFARDRCYPEALKAQLESMLAESLAEANRQRCEHRTTA